MSYVFTPPAVAAVPVAGRRRFPGAPHLLRRPQLRRARAGDGPHRPRAAVLLHEAGRCGAAGAPKARPAACTTRRSPRTCTTRSNWSWRSARAGATSRPPRAEHMSGATRVGLDMTRRDLQNEMKKQGRPWCIGKGFDQSAPIGPIRPPPMPPASSETARSRSRSTARRARRADLSQADLERRRDHRAPVGGLDAAARRPDLHRHAGGRGGGGRGRRAGRRDRRPGHPEGARSADRDVARWSSTATSARRPRSACASRSR